MKELATKWLLLTISCFAINACTIEKEHPIESTCEADSSFVNQFLNNSQLPGDSTTQTEDSSVIDKMEDGGTEDIVAY